MSARSIKAVVVAIFFFSPKSLLRADLSDLPKPTKEKPSRQQEEEKEQIAPKEEKKFSSSPNQDQETKKKAPAKKKPTRNSDNQRIPITYTGEVLFGSKQLGKVSIEQKVNVNQGDLSLRADKADIFFLDSQEGVDKVNALGNVNIDKIDVKTKELIRASGSFAQYDAKAETILIKGDAKGDAKLQRGDDLIQGNYILYNMKTGGIEAGKVAGVVSPAEKEEQK